MVGSSNVQPLSWNQRINVALGAAKGLAYLHSPGTNVIYGDFRSSSVLIDSDYNAKLSDFGLEEDEEEVDYFYTRVITTNGYSAPEYKATGYFIAKSDIYNFGVVFLEIMTGRRCIDRNRPYNEQILVDFAKPYLTNKRRIFRIMDQRIDGQYSSTVAKRAGMLVIICLSENPKHRPTADEVVKELKQLQELQKAAESSRREPIRRPNDRKPVSYRRPIALASASASTVGSV